MVTVHLPGSIQRISDVEHVKETGDGITKETSLLQHKIGEAKGSEPASNPILCTSCS